MEESKTRINILGEDFIIKTDKSEEYVNSILDLFKSKLDMINIMTGKQNSLRAAILAGLLLAEENIELDASRDEEEITAITTKLIEDLDEII